MKIRPVGAELFHADRRADGRDEANGRFSRFYERALKNSFIFTCNFYINSVWHLHDIHKFCISKVKRLRLLVHQVILR